MVQRSRSSRAVAGSHLLAAQAATFSAARIHDAGVFVSAIARSTRFDNESGFVALAAFQAAKPQKNSSAASFD
jgi:hypothetical protein